MSYRPKTTKDRILHRLQIAQGHLKKVQQMVTDDVYCLDVIHQSRAVQQALKEVDNLTLEAHLHGCVMDSFRQGQQSAAISEVMQIFKKT